MYETGSAGNRIFVYGNYIDEVLLRPPFIYYVHDHLYSPVALLFSTGTVLERYEYDAYGNPNIWNADFTAERANSNYGNPYLFTGRRVDILDSGSLKIQYNRNRYYDYYSGRWLTQDPLDFVDGMNRYEYVQSNPVTGGDPWALYNSPLDLIDLSCLWKHNDSYEIDGVFPPWAPWQHGEWDSVDPSPSEMWEVMKEWWAFWAMANYGALIGEPDAAKHLKHYLLNWGTPIETSYHRLLKDSEEAREDYLGAQKIAMREAERLVTSTDKVQWIVQDGHSEFDVDLADNWYHAISTYHTFGRGKARKGKGRRSCCYDMTWWLYLRDNYEYEGRPLREMNLYGIAQHFRITGSFKRSITWVKGYDFSEKETSLVWEWPFFPQCQK